jgi:hypothetical protein
MFERLVPYDAETWLSVTARYQETLWPGQAVGLAVLVTVLALWLRRVPQSPRLLAAALGAAWLWCGIAWEWRTHGMLNWAGWVFGTLFGVQAALLLWTGVVRGRSTVRLGGGFRAGMGACLVLAALVAAPVAAVLWGGDWRGATVAGVSPLPTVALTVGVLLLAGPAPPVLLVVPLAWSAYALVVAWTLGLGPDAALLGATVIGALLAPWRAPRRRHRR